jgi:hypothetical protein
MDCDSGHWAHPGARRLEKSHSDRGPLVWYAILHKYPQNDAISGEMRCGRPSPFEIRSYQRPVHTNAKCSVDVGTVVADSVETPNRLRVNESISHSNVRRVFPVMRFGSFACDLRYQTDDSNPGFPKLTWVDVHWQNSPSLIGDF